MPAVTKNDQIITRSFKSSALLRPWKKKEFEMLKNFHYLGLENSRVNIISLINNNCKYVNTPDLPEFLLVYDVFGNL